MNKNITNNIEIGESYYIYNNDNLFALFRILSNLYICEPNFVVDVFQLIKEKSDKPAFDEYLKYFEK